MNINNEEKATWKELNPQQTAFLSYYLDPTSETWSQSKASAIKAGFSEEYATNILSLMPKWLSENLQDSGLISKALSNLSTFIDDGENKNIQWDATKFTLSRLHKEKFSERQEQTGKGGKDLIPETLSPEEKEKLLKLIK